MSLATFLQNLMALVVQGVLVTAVAAALVRVLPIERPALELAGWRMLLLGALTFPFLGISTPLDAGRIRIAVGILEASPGSSGSFLGRCSWSEITAAALAFGILWRGVRLVGGALRLRTCRLRAVPYDTPALRGLEDLVGARADLRLSPDVSVPATFGLRRPVVLLPTHVAGMEESRQRAIVAHELIHVRRRDWPQAVGEEILATALWFHPAIHVLLARIRLAREQCVDAAVVAALGGRKAYLESLLEVARRRLQAGPVPAALFLGEHHLTERVELLLKEVVMSKARAFSHLSVSAFVLTVAGVAASAAFPLLATAWPAEENAPATKEKGKPGEPRIVHKVNPVYPPEAKRDHIQGIVHIATRLAKDGSVAEAEAKDGPAILAEAALAAVRQWRYEPVQGADKKPVEVMLTITINFRLEE